MTTTAAQIAEARTVANGFRGAIDVPSAFYGGEPVYVTFSRIEVTDAGRVVIHRNDGGRDLEYSVEAFLAFAR